MIERIFRKRYDIRTFGFLSYVYPFLFASERMGWGFALMAWVLLFFHPHSVWPIVESILALSISYLMVLLIRGLWLGYHRTRFIATTAGLTKMLNGPIIYAWSDVTAYSIAKCEANSGLLTLKFKVTDSDQWHFCTFSFYTVSSSILADLKNAERIQTKS